MVYLNGNCDRCGAPLEYDNDNGHEVKPQIDRNGNMRYNGRCRNGHWAHIIDFYSNGNHIGRENRGRAFLK